MGSQSTTAHARSTKTCYSAFVLTAVSMIIFYLVCAPIAHARWYDPERGAFISREPLLEHMPGLPGAPNLAVASNDPRALHPYAFTYNDPINFYDPDGEAAHAAGIILVVVIVAGVVLYLAADITDTAVQAKLRAQCNLGCIASDPSTKAGMENALGDSATGGIKITPKPGAPKSCAWALCQAVNDFDDANDKSLSKGIRKGAKASAHNLIRFWNQYCAGPGGQIK